MRAVAGAIVLGAALRLEHLLGGRSMHIDEARLALNIGQRSFVELLQPLAYEQTAPIPFLWMEKAAALVGGMNEIALRTVPFILGIALLVAMYHLARRVLPPPAVALAVALAAVSPVLVHYSNEIKPYMLDALFGVALTSLALDLVRSRARRTWFRFAALGTIAVLASTPAILVLCGLSAVIVLESWRRGDRLAREVMVALAIWIVIFSVLYVAFYRVMSSHPYMRTFWEPAFLTPAGGPILPRIWGMASELIWGTLMGGYVHGVRARDVLVTVGLATATISVVVIAGGIFLARIRGGVTVLVLAAPAIVTVAASAVGVYPISLRLVLYLVPALLIFVCAGVMFAGHRIPLTRRAIVLAIVTTAVLTRPFLRSSVPKFWPYHRQELRQLIASLDSRDTREPVYVFANAAPAWLFYTTDWSAPDTSRLNWYARVAGADGPAFENAAPRPYPVRDEGKGLEFRYRGRREIVGISTGEQWRVIVGSRWHMPDPGWGRNEAARIVAAAQPAIWLVFSHFRGSENGLLNRLEASGLEQTYTEPVTGAHLFRYAKNHQTVEGE